MSTTITRPSNKPSASNARVRGEFINRYVNTIYGLDPDGPAEHDTLDFWGTAWDYAYTTPHKAHVYWTESMIDCVWDRLEPYMAMSVEDPDYAHNVEIGDTLVTDRCQSDTGG